jgi:ATP-binding cassette subfamily B protein
VPLTQLDASWWRKQVALVAQEPVLFACSVADNIRYGSTTTGHDAVVAAARTANAHTFVNEVRPQTERATVGQPPLSPLSEALHAPSRGG